MEKADGRIRETEKKNGQECMCTKPGHERAGGQAVAVVTCIRLYRSPIGWSARAHAQKKVAERKAEEEQGN